jgi:hypothetical protein
MKTGLVFLLFRDPILVAVCLARGVGGCLFSWFAVLARAALEVNR